MRAITKILTTTSVTLICCSVVASADKPQKNVDIRDIQLQALNWANNSGYYVGDDQRVKIMPGKVDPRLRFTACENPLSFEPQKTSTRSNRALVKVRCNDAKPWAIFVPLEITRFIQAPVLKASVMRGEPVARSDVSLQEIELNRPTGNLFERLDDVIGLIAKRTLPEGHALTEFDLKRPKLVKKGDDVVIEATSGSVTVKMQGTALADGYQNQQVKVKNNRSQRTIKAIVTSPGQVKAVL